MSLSFDGPNKLIVLSSGTVSLGVPELWSRWVDWVAESDNSKYLPAMRSVGGDETDPGEYIPIYTFLLNGWRIRPQNADHTLTVDDGVLRVDGGGDPFVNTVDTHQVRVRYKQPVQAIMVATGGSTGPTAAEIAAAVLAAMNTAPPAVNVKQVNGVTIQGTGVPGSDPWRPA